MSYSISQWRECVEVLRLEPNKPLCEIAERFKMNLSQACALVKDVCETWKIERVITENKRPEHYRKDNRIAFYEKAA